MVDVWSSAGRFPLTNFYNPCLQLDIDKLDKLMGQVRPQWCGWEISMRITCCGADRTEIETGQC